MTTQTANKTAKNINVGDALALRHDFKRVENGVAWVRDENGEYIPDTTTALEPCIRGWGSFAATFKTIVAKEVTKEGNCTVTIFTCEDGDSYRLYAKNAYVVAK